MTFADVLKNVEIPAVKKDSPLIGYFTGDDNNISISICKGKTFNAVLNRIRTFKMAYPRLGRWNGANLTWDFSISLLKEIRENFHDLDDRTGDLEVPNNIPTVVKQEVPKFAGKAQLYPDHVLITWHKQCTPAEFQQRLGVCKEIKVKFGGRGYVASIPGWSLNATAAAVIRNHMAFRDFEFIGDFPEPMMFKDVVGTDELTNKLRAEAERLVKEVMPSGRTLFEHQKAGVLWLVSRPEMVRDGK